MTTDPHGKRSVILECGCGKYFAPPYPLRGERTYCGLKPGHGWTRIKYGPAVYRSKCLDCSAGRKHGTSIGLAYESISRHLRQRPAHTVVLYDGLVIVDRIAPDDTQTLEKVLTDAPPF